jgi:hypothetical protein
MQVTSCNLHRYHINRYFTILIAILEFWKSAPKNPNKKPRDYHEKFEHSMPLPVVENGELLFTLEGSKVYLQIIRRLAVMDAEHPTSAIQRDSGDLLRLIVDHIQSEFSFSSAALKTNGLHVLLPW